MMQESDDTGIMFWLNWPKEVSLQTSWPFLKRDLLVATNVHFDSMSETFFSKKRNFFLQPDLCAHAPSSSIWVTAPDYSLSPPNVFPMEDSAISISSKQRNIRRGHILFAYRTAVNKNPPNRGDFIFLRLAAEALRGFSGNPRKVLSAKYGVCWAVQMSWRVIGHWEDRIWNCITRFFKFSFSIKENL